MPRTFMIMLAALGLSTAAMAQGPRPLDDSELEQISGGDGVNIAMHLALNDPALAGSTKNRLTWGFNDGTQTTYMVIDNLSGTIDMYALGISVENKPDGSGGYIAVSLPTHLRFTNFGFESLSAQTDPSGPVTGSLGGIGINGTMSMQGQLRIWPH